eukprot:546207_1
MFKEKKNKNIIYDIMDMIHIYICHSYHIGYRNICQLLKPNELSLKHDLISKIRPFNRFQTNINQNNIKKNLKKNNLNNNNNKYPFCFGNKYYFWDNYKNNEMYIGKKFKDLKCEIKDYYLNIEEYICIVNKCNQLLKTNI